VPHTGKKLVIVASAFVARTPPVSWGSAVKFFQAQHA
jgi:hypothetical protein